MGRKEPTSSDWVFSRFTTYCARIQHNCAQECFAETNNCKRWNIGGDKDRLSSNYFASAFVGYLSWEQDIYFIALKMYTISSITFNCFTIQSNSIIYRVTAGVSHRRCCCYRSRSIDCDNIDRVDPDRTVEILGCDKSKSSQVWSRNHQRDLRMLFQMLPSPCQMTFFVF